VAEQRRIQTGIPLLVPDELDDRDQTYAAAWTTLGSEVDSIAVLAATLTVEELADEVLRTHDAQSLSVPS
jgi:hypothetical protein